MEADRNQSEATIQIPDTGKVSKSEDFVERNGVKIFSRKWTASPQKATLVLIHGIGEHCSRYDELCTFFAQQGISTVSFDQQGFGQTTGPKGVSNLKQMIENIKYFSDSIKSEQKHFVFGHSMGGGLALTFASLYPQDVDGVIASAPLVSPGSGSRPNVIEKLLLRTLPKYMPEFTLPNVMDLSNLTHDEEEIQKYKADSLIHDRLCLQLAADILQMGNDLLETHAHSFEKPLLISHGTKDVLTCPIASKDFFEKIPAKDKTYHSFEGLYHELHNEPQSDRKQVYDLYVQWLAKHV
jgi:acylglycerol lipase